MHSPWCPGLSDRISPVLGCLLDFSDHQARRNPGRSFPACARTEFLARVPLCRCIYEIYNVHSCFFFCLSCSARGAPLVSLQPPQFYRLCCPCTIVSSLCGGVVRVSVFVRMCVVCVGVFCVWVCCARVCVGVLCACVCSACVWMACAVYCACVYTAVVSVSTGGSIECVRVVFVCILCVLFEACSLRVSLFHSQTYVSCLCV